MDTIRSVQVNKIKIFQLKEENGNYSGSPIFEYNTNFIGLILKTEKFEYLILKFNKPMISMNYVYKNSGITKSSKKSHVISIS